MTAFGLSRYPGTYLDRLAECAALSDRLGQLAHSHPLLFFALATGYGPLPARREAVRRAELGYPLRDVCEPLGIPYALRRIAPEALLEPLVEAGMSERTAQVVAGRIRRMEAAAGQAYALRAAFLGARICDDDFGLWLTERRRIRALPADLEHIRPVALYAWCSRYDTLLPEQVWRRRWTPKMTWPAAVHETRLWLDHVKFYAYFGEEPIADPWAAGGSVAGFDIVPLCTFPDLIEEVHDMENCLYSYADRLLCGACRLFGVRAGGCKIGTIEVRRTTGGKLQIAQFRGPGNANMSQQAWRAAFEWVEAQNDGPARATPKIAKRREWFQTLAGEHAQARALPDRFWPSPACIETLEVELQALLLPRHGTRQRHAAAGRQLAARIAARIPEAVR